MFTSLRRLAPHLAACLLALAALGATAAEPGAEHLLSEKLAQLFTLKTGMKADSVSKAPAPGFYEFVVGTSVFYMDPSGKWLIDGHLVDLDTRRSVTAARRAALEAADKPKLDWRALNLADAIKGQQGQATKGRVLVVFEDPNCGYCRKLTPVLQSIPNLVTYNFPIAILGPDSRQKNEALWCTKDRGASWAAVMKGSSVKAERPCDTSALVRNGELAQKLRVSGTPTMFLADGTRLTGYMEAPALEQELARVERAMAAAVH